MADSGRWALCPRPCHAQTYDTSGGRANPVGLPPASVSPAALPLRHRVAGTQPGYPQSVEQTPPARTPVETRPWRQIPHTNDVIHLSSASLCSRPTNCTPRSPRRSSSRAVSVSCRRPPRSTFRREKVDSIGWLMLILAGLGRMAGDAPSAKTPIESGAVSCAHGAPRFSPRRHGDGAADVPSAVKHLWLRPTAALGDYRARSDLGTSPMLARHKWDSPISVRGSDPSPACRPLNRRLPAGKGHTGEATANPPERNAEAAAVPSDTSWRRTRQGWERSSQWTLQPKSRPPAVGPIVAGLLELFLGCAALIGLPEAGGRWPQPKREPASPLGPIASRELPS
jgi:hypothetical protein